MAKTKCDNCGDIKENVYNYSYLSKDGTEDGYIEICQDCAESFKFDGYQLEKKQK